MVIDALNLKATKLQRDKTKEVMVILGNQLKLKTHQLDSLTILLQRVGCEYRMLVAIRARELIWERLFVKVSSGKIWRLKRYWCNDAQPGRKKAVNIMLL